MKYKPCCDSRCLLSHCETRENGGCYCICRLKDWESSLTSELEGNTVRTQGAMVYRPGIYPSLEGQEKKRVLDELRDVQEKLKKYELRD